MFRLGPFRDAYDGPAPFRAGSVFLGVRVDGNNTARMMHRAFGVNANGAGSACTLAVDHDGWLGGSARCNRLCVFILDFNLCVLPARKGAGLPLVRIAAVCLDPHQLGSRGHFAVDMLGMVAISVEALCGIRATGKYFPLARRRVSRMRA
jgi:hypothetical protein